MPDSAVVYAVKDHVAGITINRPETGNLISEPMAAELDDICRKVNQDDAVYVVVISGSGGDFCRGGGPLLGDFYRCPAAALAGIDRPVIVAINGDALGLGLELALAGDIRVASDKARFAMPQLEQGSLPQDGGTQRLPRIVGSGKAMEMLLSAETFGAAEALEMGLVNRVVPAAELAADVAGLAASLAVKGPVALRYIKEAVKQGLDMTLEQGLRLEADLYFLLHTTADRTEGIRAFLEKRTPRFRGE